MTTMFLALGAMLFIMAAMAVGVIMGRKPISGSCGGIGNLGINHKCDICGNDPNKCETEIKKVKADEARSLSYDAGGNNR